MIEPFLSDPRIRFVCPRCRAALLWPQSERQPIRCAAHCGAGPFPFAGGRPVFIDDDQSLFRRENYPRQEGPGAATGDFYASSRPDWLTRFVRALPAPARNIAQRENFDWLLRQLAERGWKRVLVVGAGVEHAFPPPFARAWTEKRIDVLPLDVSLRSFCAAIADAHQLPLPDGCADAVVCQAVLEHVLDPDLAASELFRVCRLGGLALVEAPLCYPTHDWPYDFHRFTLAGLRVLMRGFDCVAMGPAVGPGSAAALAFRDFLVSLAPPRARWQVPMRLIASLATFWWKWLDRPASRRPAGLGASAGFFFLGARRETPLSRKISFLPSCSSSGSDDG